MLHMCFVFFFNDTATTEIYTLSLHDALPISVPNYWVTGCAGALPGTRPRSEEHTSELQSRGHLVCRLLLEKKKKKQLRQTKEKQRETQNKNKQNKTKT